MSGRSAFVSSTEPVAVRLVLVVSDAVDGSSRPDSFSLVAGPSLAMVTGSVRRVFGIFTATVDTSAGRLDTSTSRVTVSPLANASGGATVSTADDEAVRVEASRRPRRSTSARRSTGARSDRLMASSPSLRSWTRTTRPLSVRHTRSMRTWWPGSSSKEVLTDGAASKVPMSVTGTPSIGVHSGMATRTSSTEAGTLP